MANSSRLSFRELKQRVSIEQALASSGLLDGLRRQGRRLAGPCPLHGGSNPSAFHVDCSRNIWRCFTRCHAGGDLVELARRLSDGTFRGASIWLNRLAGQLSPACSPSPRPAVRVLRAPPAFRPFRRRVPLDPNCRFLAAKGIAVPSARWFEAGEYLGRGFLAACVGIRLHDPGGAPLGYAGRRLISADISTRGKWKLPCRFPKSSILFNFHRTRLSRHKGLIIVEGPWDAIKLHQAGFPNVVALLGTTAAPRQLSLIAPARRILIMMDGDPTGRLAASALRQLLKDHHEVHVAKLPDQYDPADLNESAIRAICEQHSFLSSNQ